jgi:very-short-patch-repair endonuclease
MRFAARHRVDRRVRRGLVHRPFRGAYVIGQSPLTFVERIRAALEVAPGSVVGFHTAAALQGFGIVDSHAVHVVVPDGAPVPRVHGITVHRSSVLIDPVMCLGVPCTPPPVTAIDLTRLLPRMEALPVLDAALFAKACRVDDLVARLHDLAGFSGIRRARELVPLADGRAQCRQESQLRLILHDGGFTGFVPQFPVPVGDSAYFLDLADPALMIGVEYDGVSHADKGRLGPDRVRHNFLEDRGWRMRYATHDDIYYRPARFLATVARAARCPLP